MIEFFCQLEHFFGEYFWKGSVGTPSESLAVQKSLLLFLYITESRLFKSHSTLVIFLSQSVSVFFFLAVCKQFKQAFQKIRSRDNQPNTILTKSLQNHYSERQLNEETNAFLQTFTDIQCGLELALRAMQLVDHESSVLPKLCSCLLLTISW